MRFLLSDVTTRGAPQLNSILCLVAVVDLRPFPSNNNNKRETCPSDASVCLPLMGDYQNECQLFFPRETVCQHFSLSLSSLMSSGRRKKKEIAMSDNADLI